MVKIVAYIPDFTVKCLKVTLSCNWCGKVCDVPPESSYVCDSCHSCATSIVKLFFDFTATDGTSTLNLVAHSRIAEQLLKVTPAAVHSMGDTELVSFTDKTSQELRTEKTEMLLTPVVTLHKDHNKLRWMLKEIL